MLRVSLEYTIQLSGEFFVKNESIGFIIVAQASAVEIGCAYRAECFIYHHDFRVVESSVIQIYICSAFHQFVDFVE
mgnify:CR=1 FL=1